jgi:hypothetical protein
LAALRFAERMSGTFYFLDDALTTHDVSLELEANLRNMRTRVASVTGRIHAKDLADAPVQGTLGFQAVHEKRVPYDLSFVDVRGRALRLRGEKDLRWLAPVETLLLLPFTILDDEREIARGEMRFDRTLSSLARSLRFAPL